MMRAELAKAIEEAWRNSKPLTTDTALSIAVGILSKYPREMSGFRDWFQTNGELAIRRING